MTYSSGVERATIIIKSVRDWKKLEIIAQQYTCPFAAINNSIYAYNQIEQKICDRPNDHNTRMTTEI